jgi:hypothetical protein
MTSTALTPVFIHYAANNKTPVAVGPVVSKSKIFQFYKKWDQADTAEQCHSNAFKIYDRRRSQEDERMLTMQQTLGLGIRVINDNPSPKVGDFYNLDTSGTDDIQASVNVGDSVELFGFFKPTVKGRYTFSLDGDGVNATNHRMWIGDHACHDYLDSNQIKNLPSPELFPNKYYAVRFQYMNTTNSTRQFKIKARRDGAHVADSHFVSLFKDGLRFNRRLLYYGLVATKPETDKYYCYFNSPSDYDEIRKSLGIDYIERSVDLQSDANPPPKTGQKIAYDSRPFNFKTDDDMYNYSITNAKYQIKPRTCLYVPETDPKKLSEKYQVRTTKEVTKKILGKNVKVNIPVLETRTRPRNAPPICTRPMRDVTTIAKGLAQQGLIKADAGIANYDTIWGGTLGQGIETQTVIDYTTRMKDDLKQNKTIRVNEKCQVVVNYDTNTTKYGDAVLYTSTRQNCSDKRIELHGNGKVTINGPMSIWLDILSSNPNTDQSSLVSIPSWNGPSALSVGANLSTLVSNNKKFKLHLNSVTGKLKGYYAIKATHKSGSVKYSKPESPNAFFLYRPNYSELGEKRYLQQSVTKLVEVKATQLNDSWPIQLGYKHVKGYPLQQHYTDISGNCQFICNGSTDCGNYVAYGSGQCLIDTTSNVRPAYTTTKPSTGPFTNNKPSIYIKTPVMTSPYSFKQESAGNYSEYTVVPDPRPATVINTTAPVQSTIQTYASLSQHNSAASAVEGFSDIPPRFSNKLPDAPETSVEEGRIEDLQTIMFQQNVLYSVSSIAALSFLVGAIVLARK